MFRLKFFRSENIFSSQGELKMLFNRAQKLKSITMKMFGFDRSLIVCMFFTLCWKQISSECTQLTPCSCMFSNGEGYDLTPLRIPSPLQVTSDNYTFYFHPCTNFPLTKGECHADKGVSLCVQQGNTIYSLGTAEETKIEAGSNKVPSLILSHGNYTSTIALICCDSCKSHLIKDQVNENGQFYLLLRSPYACKASLRPKGLSGGSILLIIFFVCTGVYFISGIIALKLLRGATGWEMIPNHTFWQELPSLVKDGIAFTFNCCRVDSYDSI